MMMSEIYVNDTIILNEENEYRYKKSTNNDNNINNNNNDYNQS